jgi:hypothetical protein
MPVIAKQLHRLLTHGLLDQHQNGRSLTVAPPVPVTLAVDSAAQTWTDLTG